MQHQLVNTAGSPPARHEQPVDGDSYWTVGFRVTTLVLTYYLLNMFIARLAKLPSDSYREPVLVVELAKSAASSVSWAGPVGPAVMAAALTILAWRYRRQLLTNWIELDVPRSIRVVVVVVAALLAWTFSTYDTNLFFGQLHLLDRVLLVILVGLIGWRPVFVAPYLVLVITLIGQLATPLTGFSAAEPKLPIRILMVFLAFVVLRVLTRRIHVRDFTFVMLVMVASFYFVAGFGKLRLGWITHGQMDRLMVATYANGWLGFLEPSSVVSLARSMVPFDLVLRVLTLVAEVGALVALWRRSTLMGWLTMWAGLHVGVVLVSGIFFWKWLVLDIVLLLVLWKQRDGQPIFTRPYFLASVGLILTSPLWLQPTDLSWFNSRITYTYRMVATVESGEEFSLSPQFFAPYDYQFTIGLLQYLSEHPLLPVAWGATDLREVADAVVDPDDPLALAGLEAELGRDFYDPDRAEVFDGFVRDFVSEVNRRETKTDWVSWFAPVPQLVIFERDDAFDGEERIVSVTVLLVTSQYDDTTYEEIRTEVLRVINIATDPAIEDQSVNSAATMAGP